MIKHFKYFKIKDFLITFKIKLKEFPSAFFDIEAF